MEDLRDGLLHLDEPFLADTMHGILVAIDDVACSISTFEIVRLSIAGVLKLLRRAESFVAFIRRAVGAPVDVTEASIAQATVFCELFFACKKKICFG